MPVLGSLLPPFDGVPLWCNGPKPAETDLAGNPVLVHFFSSDCSLCHEGMPIVNRLHAVYAPSGLVVVGTYQPRHNAPATIADAERALDLDIRPDHPCALDVGGVLAARFANKWPPAYYVFDRAHRLRHYQMGNWNLDAIAAIVDGCMLA